MFATSACGRLSKGGGRVVKTTFMDDKDDVKELKSFLGKAYQSSHLNFLIGSGASTPAIGLAGKVEQEIQREYESGKDENIKTADRKKYRFLRDVQNPTNLLIRNEPCCKNARTTVNYKRLLNLIANILYERNTTLLPRQASIFTTNYDLFIEKAGEHVPGLILNDGFGRTSSFSMRHTFSPQLYFNSTVNTGNLFNYRAELPTVNLLKVHGSLSWYHEKANKQDSSEKDQIVFKVREIADKGENPCYDEVKKYLDSFYLVLPEYHKFRSAVIDRNYYELLRIYANELQRENCLLLVFGFSFADEHILEITLRALKNVSLKIVILSYDRRSACAFGRKFDGFPNVEIVAPCGDNKIGFDVFGDLLRARPTVKRSG